MKSFIKIIKLDYLQRTRSYSFLITLCVSLAIAYTFVPEPNATYSTIRIDDYVGYYNSAWFGYVTAIITSITLSLIGFFLINSGIKTDISTRVGQVVAATSISNFKYLFSKVLSNFLVLITIIGIVFIMSIILFFLYNDGFVFEPLQFIKPYIFITIPSMFFIAVLAVVFEIVFGKYSVVQNCIFFFLFLGLMQFTPKNNFQYSLDIFGTKIVMNELENTVKKIININSTENLSIGYVLKNVKKAKKFHFNGISFPTIYLLSRFIWILIGVGIIAIIAPFFHRFNVKEKITKPTKNKVSIVKEFSKEIELINIPKASLNYSRFPLLKTELLLLIRKDKKWMWIINLIGMLLLTLLPLTIAHQMVLPILWFLQVNRLSDITTKEITNNTHYFSFSSFKPLSRLLVTQLYSSILLLLFLASPLIIRLVINTNFLLSFSVFLGGIFIVLLASVLGMISKGKKLFEVMFFMITYANINGIVFVDYFGGFEHNQFYPVQLSIITLILGSACFFIRNYQLKG
ncbi:hypothetical protein [Lutibacter citreus]|uniref:hypothetical protein n=1 Tax=Lutibacter citreus TaxID=2138210 RepID=UPI000DBE3D44|nr:hypothetical protein [Lutibacter citreus]